MALATTSSSEAGGVENVGSGGIARQRTEESRRSNDQTRSNDAPINGEATKKDVKKKSKIAELLGKLELDVPTVLMMMKYGEMDGLWNLC
jgi:hypothetical protein